ncbi:molybdopterin-dependent oxidoreductase [Nocardioides dongkuii]|uniref:molybdopterin-dependent oxidoreductase n=1 Tax=Nocardioides dongkuii TaxID=2760089 RepID=UPI001FD39E0E|nr:molybdopterin-dependent oxidoreductase [Nocardioides dongkuii]
METSRPWSLAGLAAGLAGLATSYAVAMALTVRESPVVAVAEVVIQHLPGPLVDRAIDYLGAFDKPVLVLVIVLVLAGLFAWAGRLARRSWWAPAVVFAVLAAIGAAAVVAQRNQQPVDFVPVAAGLVTWLVCLSLLTEPLRRARPEQGAAGRDESLAHTRRVFLVRAGLVAGAAVVVGAVGRVVGSGRRRVEQARGLLKLTGVTAPRVPPAARVGVEGVSPWMTPTDDFYQIHAGIGVPVIEPKDWSLRVHGMVDRELVLSYADLVEREFTEAWVTLACVSNEVGGDLIGNAWWSGVRVADLLAEAGVQEGADAVKQTSDDGWTCGTPLAALTDDRNALLAVAMNGRPLPIDHGFPVRTVVPGLYGYVSATKWVVDLEVTRFEDFEAFWTTKGWAELGPVKMSSRIDVPRSGDDLEAGEVRIAGVAWAQHTGIESVEVSVDGGAWQRTELARTPSVDTWVQWALTTTLEPGDHVLRVRATDLDGAVQTGAVSETVPDGATGWHEVEVSVSDG